MEEDSIWRGIQLAESFLLSAMYPEAATKASDILTALNVTSSRCRELLNYPLELENPESRQLKQAVEAAGMVLLQATSEMGRLGSVFSVLEEHFGGIHCVPHFLFLPGVALQVSGGVFYSARLVLEAFLAEWSLSEATFQHTKVHEGCNFFLTREAYGDLAEIYTLHVLAKGLSDPNAALDWLRGADMLESRRQHIIQKIVPITQERRADLGVVTQAPQEVVRTISEIEDREPAPLSKVQVATRPGFSYLLNAMRVHIEAGAMRHWKGVAAGTFTFILAYAILKKRDLIKRRARSGLSRVRAMLLEFWELAFGLQINPLAAVQAMPLSSH